MNYRYSTLQQNDILDLKHKGLSSRKIAKELGLSKSGVNDFLKRSKEYLEVKVVENKPKILFLDLETACSIVGCFGRFKQNIGQANVIKEGGWLLTACWKFLGDKQVQEASVSPSQAVAMDDSEVVHAVFDAIERSDIIVAHNANGFDIGVIKARMLINGFPAMKKVRVIDTLQQSRQFRFNSNRLDSLCSQLDIGRKVQHSGTDLWLRCQNGDTQALAEMLEYNKQDVLLLEELYLALRHYDTKHPNLAVYYKDAKLRCNCCGSERVETTGNLVYTNLSSFEEFMCLDCSARFRNRVSGTTKEQRGLYLSN